MSRAVCIKQSYHADGRPAYDIVWFVFTEHYAVYEWQNPYPVAVCPTREATEAAFRLLSLGLKISR